LLLFFFLEFRAPFEKPLGRFVIPQEDVYLWRESVLILRVVHLSRMQHALYFPFDGSGLLIACCRREDQQFYELTRARDISHMKPSYL
jgi:hypothetical protein